MIMADSDDEYDRKRRDKFRGERSSGDNYRSERRGDERRGGAVGIGGGGRDDWTERNNPFRAGAAMRQRPDYRDYRGHRERYGSPGREMPPPKRMRPDWGDDLRPAPRFGPYDPYLMHAWNEHYAAHTLHNPYVGGGGGGGGGGGIGGGVGMGMMPTHGGHLNREPPIINSDLQTQPPMMSLKQFLDTQDDGISDSEVLRKYSEYKLEFKRQQLNEFFVAHKDEEWFKNKYHPTDSSNRKEEQLNFLQRRVGVFTELLENEYIKKVSVDTNQTDPLLRLLDTVVIKLEGGTEDDLKILDEKPKDIFLPERIIPEKKVEADDDVIITSVEETTKKSKDDAASKQDEPKCVSPQPTRCAPPDTNEENWDDVDDDATKPKPEEVKKSLKRKRANSNSSVSSSSESNSSNSTSVDEDNDQVTDKYDLARIKYEKLGDSPVKMKEGESGDEKDLSKESENIVNSLQRVNETAANFSKDNSTLNGNTKLISNNSKSTNISESCNDVSVSVEEDDREKDKNSNNNDNTNKIISNNNVEIIEVNDKNITDQPETIDLDKVKDGPQPRALHRTSSIFLRNLAPTITKAEIEAICQRFDGYLRVAIADPLVERRWYRRGWVTFKRDVNIKEICWSLNNTRLKDCEMGAIVNRDLSRRVRPVNGMTAHKTVVRSDIKLCAKIIMNLDEKFKLWQKGTSNNAGNNPNSNDNENTDGGAPLNNNSGSTDKSSPSYGFQTRNPILQNITDFLIEEASAEEDELLGIAGENKDNDGEVIERDPQLISVLDCLILYLRVVHSVDFYNHCEYPYEDEMPNRCGIIHARGPPPSKVAPNDMQDYIKNFENKMQTFLLKSTSIDGDELKNLGCKDAEAEVEKFIQANTQELAKDKWLCPLSGKKFKGPEFIRKHIFNKHAEKVDEVRKEVEFFNNYLKDPKRPQLPEHPGNTKRQNSESGGPVGSPGGGLGFRAPMYPPTYAPPYAAYAPPLMMSGRGGRGFGGGGRRELPIEHQRRIIGYHDLDAPANFDIFD